MKKFTQLETFLFLVIIVLAGFVRFYHLNELHFFTPMLLNLLWEVEIFQPKKVKKYAHWC